MREIDEVSVHERYRLQEDRDALNHAIFRIRTDRHFDKWEEGDYKLMMLRRRSWEKVIVRLMRYIPLQLLEERLGFEPEVMASEFLQKALSRVKKEKENVAS